MPPAICIPSVGFIRTALSPSASGAVAAKEHGLDCLALLPLHLSRRVVGRARFVLEWHPNWTGRLALSKHRLSSTLSIQAA